MIRCDGIIHYSGVTHSIFYNDHRFYFFLFMTYSAFCLLYHLFSCFSDFLLNSCLLTFGLLKYKTVIKEEIDQVPEFLQGSYSLCNRVWNTFAEYLSVLLQNTSYLYFCRTCLSIFADYLLVFMQSTFQYSQYFAENSQYFYRKPLSMFSKHLLLFQNMPQ